MELTNQGSFGTHVFPDEIPRGIADSYRRTTLHIGKEGFLCHGDTASRIFRLLVGQLQDETLQGQPGLFLGLANVEAEVYHASFEGVNDRGESIYGLGLEHESVGS